jgi:osmoprotectant transport system permease protein
MSLRSWLLLLLFSWTSPAHAESAPTVKVGSKAFTESVLLGEIAVDLARSAGARASHQRALGGTQVLWKALLRGDLDVYPEYTGTLTREILAKQALVSEEELQRELASLGVEMSPPLGYNNTYALGVREDLAERLSLRAISDLGKHPELRFGLSSEFMDRADGWPGLRDRYALPHKNVTGIVHDLAYRGLASGDLDVTDLYSTDAEIAYYQLRVLLDDASYFPPYDAVLLYRADLRTRAPHVVERLRSLAGRIDAKAMIGMNAQAKLQKKPEAEVAATFLSTALGLSVRVSQETWRSRLAQRSAEHLFLVLVSLLMAILVAIPLGILSVRHPRLGRILLSIVGVIQTVPSLALLVFMIPLLGIGTVPAVVALFLYGLLPIVQNTHAGLRGIPTTLCETATALGLSPRDRLLRIELPMASPAILAGIKTSAVINVGTATLGAVIGAGGYGQPILTGIRLDDVGLLLEGAVPAALLALLVQLAFDLVERGVVPAGLRPMRE